MPTTRLHRSPWQATTTPGATYPRLGADVETDVVIVGGGLTGLLCAGRLVRAGAGVVLVERDLVGGGSTAGAAGVLEAGPGVPFAALRERVGLRAAKAIWAEARQAAVHLVAHLRRRKAACALEEVPHLDLALDESACSRVRGEHEALVAAGADAGWLEGARLRRAVGAPAVGALRRAGWTLDPLRAARALAADAVGAGALVFERSEVRRVKLEPEGVRVVTARGSVRAADVVVATGVAAPGFAALSRHSRWVDHYFVEVAVPDVARAAFGERRAVVRDSHPSAHLWRWTPEGTLVFGGAAQPSVPDRQVERQVRQRAGQLMYELSLLYPEISGVPPRAAWRVRAATSADGLPLVGRHRAFPRHLFALAAGTGLQWAALAALVVERAWRTRPKTADSHFGLPRG
jgi:glycine/D-amino acid oxidase-like deaminating enzyme